MTGLDAPVDTVPRLLRRAAEARPDAIFLRHAHGEYTYAQTWSGALAVAERLHRLGIGHGDRVIVQAANDPDFVILWMALLRLGAVMLGVDPNLRPAESERFVARAEPAVFVLAHDAYLSNELSWPAVTVADIDALLGGWQDARERLPEHVPAPAADDVAVLIGTSGTTSAPKLVMQRHQALVLAAESFPWWLGLTGDDVLLTAMPFFHVNAQVYSTLGAMAVGATLALLPRFSASRFWDEVRRYGATQFNAVAPMAEILLAQPERPHDADNPVRLCYLAPPMAPDRMAYFERRFGVRTVVGFGMSESPFGTICPVDGSAPVGSMGRLRQHPRLGMVNEARVVRGDGSTADTGEVGELHLRNPSVFAGYYNSPEETAHALHGGWLRTGDLVRQDEEGFFFHCGRLKEMIRHLGHNIAPSEIEVTLRAHSAVRDAAVVGVPSPLGEQDVIAFVVLDPFAGTTAALLEEHCRQNLAPYKVPARFRFVDELPRTATGRVAKHKLTEQGLDERAVPR